MENIKTRKFTKHENLQKRLLSCPPSSKRAKVWHKNEIITMF